MGYWTILGYCAACKRGPFPFNPYRVPSIRVNGIKEPLCRNCAERWNSLHPDRARPISPEAYAPVAEGDEPEEE